MVDTKMSLNFQSNITKAVKQQIQHLRENSQSLIYSHEPVIKHLKSLKTSNHIQKNSVSAVLKKFPGPVFHQRQTSLKETKIPANIQKYHDDKPKINKEHGNSFIKSISYPISNENHLPETLPGQEKKRPSLIVSIANLPSNTLLHMVDHLQKKNTSNNSEEGSTKEEIKVNKSDACDRSFNISCQEKGMEIKVGKRVSKSPFLEVRKSLGGSIEKEEKDLLASSVTRNSSTSISNTSQVQRRSNQSESRQLEEAKERSVSPITLAGRDNAVLMKANSKLLNITSDICADNIKNACEIRANNEVNTKKQCDYTIKSGEIVNQPLLIDTNGESSNQKKVVVSPSRASKFIYSQGFRDKTTSPLRLTKAIDSKTKTEGQSESEGANLFNFHPKATQVYHIPPDSKRCFPYIKRNESFSQQATMTIDVLSEENATKIQIHEISKVGYAGEGKKKVNQDNYFKFHNLNEDPSLIFLGVCDGHGIFGHEVSKYIRLHLPMILNTEMKKARKSFKEMRLNRVIEDSFLYTNSKLFNEVTIDTALSGSTCVSVIISPDKLICANLGDSRAVLGRYLDGRWVSCNMSRDHKPSEKDEAQRIKRRGGRIEAYGDIDEGMIGPLRVWLKNEDIPGLAMTRSFGDQVAASVGVLAEPEIKEWERTTEDRFIILASDGVWEFLTSEESVELVKDYYIKNDICGACECLYQESLKKWVSMDEVVDDITAMIVFFD